MNETLCEVAISRNLGRQPMLVVEGGREGVAASACMAVAAPGVKEGGRGLKENFPFEGDDREREREREVAGNAVWQLGHMLQLPWISP